MKAPPTSEKAFARQVMDFATMTGWMVGRTWLSIHSPAGVPDLILVRGSRLVFAELKSAIGKTTPAQDAWLAALGETAAEVYLWRPADLDRACEILR